MTQRVVEAQEARRRDVLRRKDAVSAKSRARPSRRELPHFTVGDVVLAVRVRKSGPQVKLASRWTEPWRVVSDDWQHVYTVQHLVSVEMRDAHVVGMRFDVDKELEMTRRGGRLFNISSIRRSTTLNEKAR